MASSFSRARRTTVLAGALALTALFGAAPAQAHDALASTSPADGQTITTDPGEVSITLTNPPTTAIDGANILKVTAPDGHVVSNGEITADGQTLSTEAVIDHPGEHTVDWRVVSADGHPIEGSFSFTYAPAEATPGAPSVSETATPEPVTNTAAASPEASPSQSPDAVDTASETESGGSPAWLIGAGSAVVIGLGIGLFAFLRRRNKA